MYAKMQIAIVVLAFVSWLISVFTSIPVEIGLIVFSVLMLLYALFGSIAEKAGKKYQIMYVCFILYILIKNIVILFKPMF